MPESRTTTLKISNQEKKTKKRQVLQRKAAKKKLICKINELYLDFYVKSINQPGNEFGISW
jgi:hypothetical protein